MTDSERAAVKAKKRLGQELASEEGFVAIGLSETKSGWPEIVVHLAERECAAAAKLPKTWEGFAVRSVVTGQARKRDGY